MLIPQASDDAASEIPDEDKFKYIDDLEILELVCLAGALLDYDFCQHVASDVGIDKRLLASTTFRMQKTLDNLSK